MEEAEVTLVTLGAGESVHSAPEMEVSIVMGIPRMDG